MKPYENLYGPWKLCGYNDSDYVGYKNYQISVTGYTIINNGVIISQRSKI